MRRVFSLLLSAVTGAVAFSVPNLALPAGALPALPERVPVAEPTAGAAAERPTALTARTLARQTGQRVAVAERRTETEEVLANPDGSFTMVQNTLPVRVRQGDKWVPVDATLKVFRDGTVRSVATTVPVILSGGGSAPLARIVWRGTEFAMSWPGTLPAPVLVGDTATYRNVLPDVDLVVTVDSLGFSEVLVVKTPAAAKHPDLKTLKFATSTVGLTQKVDKAGNISHVDASGQTVFQAGTPKMWDSTGGATARGLMTGSGEARQAAMPTTATSVGLAITPDQGMLADPATRYPVYVDPSVRFTGSRLAHVSVAKKFPNEKNFNENDVMRVGHETDSGMTNRTFFRMDTSTVKGKEIVAATLRTNLTYSWSCSARNVEAWHTGPINANTTWNAQPSWLTKLATVNVAKGYNSSCPGGTVDFNVLAAVRTSAAANANDVTLGLRATSETDENAWKKFANNPTLIVDYNVAPAVPTNPTTDTGIPCVTGASRPSIQNLTPTLKATIADSSATTARFEWWTTGGSKIGEAAVTVAATAASTTVPAGTFVDGGTYSWRVRSENANGQSAFTSFCEFTVDRSPPVDTPGVTSAVYPPTPPGAEPVYRGGVGVSGSFTFSPGPGDSDVTSYLYGLNEFPPSTAVTGTGTPATATVAVTPTVEGLNTLYVRARDAGGNLGPVFGYQFYVRLATMPLGHWRLDESSGTTAADASGSNLTATATGPVSWTGGRVGGAAHFAGTNGSLGTAAPPIRTNGSFTVAAWVKVDHLSGSFTAVSQDGTRQSGFYLRSTPSRWVFGMATTDTDTEVLHEAGSASAPETQGWTHLAGVYDAVGGQLTLYVNGQLQGTALHSSIWTAGGGLQIGRGLYRGAQVGWWPGDVDDVRVYQTVLPATAIRDLATVAPTLAGQWRLDETSGTVAADTSGSGRPLTASGCSWGEGWFGGAMVAGGACTAASAGPVVRTDQSFTVSAWVRLDSDTTNATVVSQDGGVNSGFQLQYVVAGTGKHWAFTMPNSDSTFETNVTARSSQQVTTNTWAHLAGVYDASARQLRLYVDGIPVAIAAHNGAWHADGSLRLGRAKWHGSPTEWWRGDIDDVRVFQGALNDDQIFQLIVP